MSRSLATLAGLYCLDSVASVGCFVSCADWHAVSVWVAVGWGAGQCGLPSAKVEGDSFARCWLGELPGGGV